MTRPEPTPAMDPSRFDGDTPTEGELAGLVAQARAAMAWRAAADALRGTGRSEDGITVEVSASGGVLEVAVPDEACRAGGRAVSEQVLDAVLAAQRDLAEQLRRSSAETFGEESSAARTVATATETRFRRAQVLPEDPDATP
ncbi:hypothetical protein KMZ32_00890 [Phycicoccus sp. MAQZ13P-2]|uniref:hypothetical protein n=1 Tax=Phycicoccus mangrovi TaxID=2840470 RepID=UPI001C007248|nr:hypothetical protein [Phycicoccus mangrovi]MBT9254247.1 hypothetical protein [Phycicoccus mangrovi]MBT9272625.1 hypothetical protein [Phycicoccus mangrovi]